MASKKKLATMALAGVLTLSLAIGGATFALFTSSAENNNNTFASGTLELSSHRHDVPIVGPMFYPSDGDAEGWMGTGLWAPRDKHTRAMLIKNTGTLEGKLESLLAIPESDPAVAQSFGEQALVTIAVLDGPFSTYSPEAIRQLNETQDAAYAAGMSFWLTRGVTRTLAQLQADIREELQRLVFESGIIVKDVYTGQLSDLISGSPTLDEVKVAPGQTLYMGYTVDFQDHADNNDVQGKDIKFTFKSVFVQTKNN